MLRKLLPKVLPLCMLFMFAQVIHAQAPQSDLKVQVGDLSFAWNAMNGVSLEAFGVPIIKGTSLWVMNPDWTDRFYAPRDQPDIIKNATMQELPNGGRRIILHHEHANGKSPFHGTETFILQPDNSYSTTLAFTFTSDEEAELEWTVGRINPDLFMGLPFSASNDQQTTSGISPLRAKSSDAKESMLASAFTKMTLNSRLGPVTIEAPRDNSLWLFDYRLNRWADKANPFYWFGIYEMDIEPNKPFSMTVSFKFPEVMKKSGADLTLTADVGLIDSPSVIAPNFEWSSIIPAPKEQKLTKSSLALDDTLKIFIFNPQTPELEGAVDFFTDKMKNWYGVVCKAYWNKSEEKTKAEKSPFLVIHCNADIKNNDILAVPDGPEAYSLEVDSKGAYLAANTPRGVINGLASLHQLVKIDDEGTFIKGVEIRDWPALSFRGIHNLSGKEKGDEISRAIGTLFAPFKFNAFVWECEYIIWDAAPEIAHPEYGMRKDDAQKVIDTALSHQIEIIPLVQSLGHSEWVFTGGKNLDIAEDPENPYATSPTAPRTYDFIFEIYQEALDFFKPRRFHIGHDEVTMLGRFPQRSKATGLSDTELILFDTLTLYNWFKERGIEMMLWGDMFLHKSEVSDAGFAPTKWDAKVRRAVLPRDVTVCDWHYGDFPPEKFKSLALFKKEGFPVIASSWYRPGNIHSLAVAAVNANIDGFLQTTWAGFNFAIEGNEVNWNQYQAYILGGWYAWTGADVAPEDLPFDARQTFLDVWFKNYPVRESSAGFFVDLQTLYNRSLEDDEDLGGWCGFGAKRDLRNFETGNLQLGETQFFVNAAADGYAAILLSGLLNPAGEIPKSVKIPMPDKKASTFHLLTAASHQASDGTEVAKLIFNFKDGTSTEESLKYGEQLFAFTDQRCSRSARIAWQGRTQDDTPARVWDLTITNPHPDKELSSIELRSSETEAAPLLMAVTAVE